MELFYYEPLIRENGNIEKKRNLMRKLNFKMLTVNAVGLVGYNEKRTSNVFLKKNVIILFFYNLVLHFFFVVI